MLEVIKLLGSYTNNSFDIWNLAGNSNAKRRAEIMSLLAGKKIPQAKSGVTAIKQELYRLSNMTGNSCEAVRSELFVHWCKKLLNPNYIPLCNHCGDAYHNGYCAKPVEMSKAEWQRHQLSTI